MSPLTRFEDLIGQTKGKKAGGQKVLGCFPLYPPVELFASMGLLPAVMWNLKGSVQNFEVSDRHVQQYACSIARELVQFTLSDSGKVLDGIFSYNACDTLRNLPEILDTVNAANGRAIPMVRMHLPQVNPGQSDPKGYLENEITSLIARVETVFDVQFSAESFFNTTANYAVMRDLCRKAEQLVAQGRLRFGAFCSTVLSGYAVPVEKQIEGLESLIRSAGDADQPVEKKVILSGIMPPPPPVIQALESQGAVVAANDIASLRRSYAWSPSATRDPVAFYLDLYTNRFPCTTLLYKADERGDALLDMVSDANAQGVIFCGEKFCEYEYFEFPYLEKQLDKKGISSLVLEFGADDADHVESHITRVEAFLEMI